MSHRRNIKVTHGTRTMSSTDPVKAVPGLVDQINEPVAATDKSYVTLADEVRDEIRGRLVYYVGDTGHMDIDPGEYHYAPNGRIISVTEPLHIEFGPGGGRTRGHDPLNKRDAEWMRRVDEWLDDGSDWRIVRFKIRKVAPGETPPPFKNWLSLNAGTIKMMVSNMLSGSRSDDVAMLKQFAEFELTCEDPRPDVLAALDELSKAPEKSDPLSVEVDL